MNKYLELMNLIQQYLNYPDVDSNSKIISAYHLVELINNDLQELRETIDRDMLKEKINKRFSPLATTRRFLLKKVTGVASDKVDFIYYQSSRNNSEISVFYKNKGSITLIRDFYSKDIYFGYPFNKEKYEYLTTDFLEYFTAIFDALEKYSIRYQSNIELSKFNKSSTTEEQKFSDGFLDISIELGRGFMMEASITVNMSADPEGIFKREWTDRITVADYIKENKNSILRKIPLYVQDLNPVFVSIIQESYNKSIANNLIRTND